MSTTAIFVELLIVGIETFIWLGFLVSSLFGVKWFSFIGFLFEKSSLTSTILFVGLAYVFGIVFDEISDTLIEPWANRIRNSTREEKDPEVWDMQAYVFSRSEETAVKLDYMRSRLRILRSTIFNLILIVLFSLLFLWTTMIVPTSNKVNITLFISIFGFSLLALVVFVYWRIAHAYWMRTRSLYKVLKEK